ncbi:MULTISPECIES: carbohydrate ABC transporter permease [Cohnella]|uniref:carbohydrate ABC transporter permease n=1 Tax=Cohnella TaxID=329857 RepID=UPI0025807DD7|nr:carbohydrate ABC transporter permease [Cohnella sp.]
MLLRWLGRLLHAAFALIVALPLLMIVFTSMKTTPEFYAHPLSLPSAWNFGRFRELFTQHPLGQYFVNSVFVTASSVLLELLLAGMIAYGIIRSGRKLGAGIFALFALGLMVPSQVNMIPIYVFVRKLGLSDSLPGLVLVTVSMLLPLGVFMLTGFMRTLPKELLEAGAIDGAGEWRLLIRVVFPLCAPYLASTAAFLSVIVWNDLLFPMLLLGGKDKMTLPLALLQFRGEYLTDYPTLMAGVVISVLPVVVLFLFLQRYFISGALAGALKG